MSSTAKHVIATLVGTGVVAAAVGAAFVWSGAYDIGADAKHSAAVKSVLETVRDRSIEVRAADLQRPDLTDEARIVQGAGNYNAMCVGCHLAPGMEPTELSRGLYPEPPNLSQAKVEPAHAFWVIKHGIKATGMPAWGKSVKDEYVWNLAAFLQRLPQLSEQQYRQTVASSGGHSHGGGETGAHQSGDVMKDHHGGDAAESSQSAPSAQAQGSAKSTPAQPSAGHHDDGHKH